jgi:rhodanese-related sulfurtransferase
MDTVVLACAVAALLLALFALTRGASIKARVDELERDMRRRTENAGAELERELLTTRNLLAAMAGGAKVTREQVLEGRLWADASASDGLALVAQGARVLDVRTAGETAGGVIPGAILIPVDELEARAAELTRDARPLLVCCAGGSRSAAACEFLAGQGFTNLFNLEGGMNAWSGQRVRPGA